MKFKEYEEIAGKSWPIINFSIRNALYLYPVKKPKKYLEMIVNPAARGFHLSFFTFPNLDL